MRRRGKSSPRRESAPVAHSTSPASVSPVVAVAGDGEALGEGLGAAHGVDVVHGDPYALGVQQAGDAGAELAEADHERGSAVQDVAAAAHEGLGGEHDGLADEEVFGVLERGAGDRDDRAGQLVEVGVAAVAVLGVLDHAEDAAGEAVAQRVEGGAK